MSIFHPGPPGHFVSDGTYFSALGASGGISPVALIEIFTVSGKSYLWAERDCVNMPSVLNGTDNAYSYQGRLMPGAKFQLYGSTETDSGLVSIENVSGNTVERDSAKALSSDEFIGAFVYFWLWHESTEAPEFIFMGNVTSADLDDAQLDLSLEGFGNWSAVRAPIYTIGVTCGLYFGGMQCGSTAPTPCNQTYGSCTSKERFQGVVIQYSGDDNPQGSQIAQPQPAAAYNPARTF